MQTVVALLDEARCFAFLREARWPDGLCCPYCGTHDVRPNGHVASQPARQKYQCGRCRRWFDDLTGTVLSGRRQAQIPLWVLCLYLMSLNRSTRQIAQELGVSPTKAETMTRTLRGGLLARQDPGPLTGPVEVDEVYITAGHKGQPAVVQAEGRTGRRRRRRGRRGRGTLTQELAPVVG